MSEIILPYKSVIAPEGEEGWSARFRLPEILPRDTVLAAIHEGIQAMKYSPLIPWEEIPEHGLEGVLIGREGDDDAEEVETVLFASDPSKQFGLRHPAASDRHALRIAELHGWTEVHDDGSEIAADEEFVGLQGTVRAIFGRNKDHYKGESAFTLAEAEDVMRLRPPFTTTGGYLFSGRPLQKPYGEPAVVVRMDAALWEPEDKFALFRAAKDLAGQRRFKLETPQGIEVFEATF